MWTRDGDFQTTIKSVNGSMKEVTYKCDNPSSVISELRLRVYQDGNVAVQVTGSSVEKYAQLRQAFCGAGFPEPSFTDKMLKYITLVPARIPIVTIFIKVIQGIEIYFAEIKDEVCHNLNIDLTQEYQNPTWFKSSSIHTDRKSAGKITRMQTYRCGNPSSVISELALCHYTSFYAGESFMISAQASSRVKYDQLKQAIIDAGFPDPEFYEETIKTVRLVSAEILVLTNFIKAIQRIEIRFEEIKDEVCRYLKVKLPQEVNTVEYALTSRSEETGSATFRL